MGKQKHWIAGAVSHPGAFTNYAKRKHISVTKAIAVGSHSKNTRIRKEAVLARTLRGFHHRH